MSSTRRAFPCRNLVVPVISLPISRRSAADSATSPVRSVIPSAPAAVLGLGPPAVPAFHLALPAASPAAGLLAPVAAGLAVETAATAAVGVEAGADVAAAAVAGEAVAAVVPAERLATVVRLALPAPNRRSSPAMNTAGRLPARCPLG
jgi:hypothetical protein